LKNKTTSGFWTCYERLPAEVRELADKNFHLLQKNTSHPSLQFKKCGKVWSVRVSSQYRAIATSIEGGFLWVWIGTHAEYERLLASQN
jgi:hypothetical protein